jgi:hypothetical protein
MKLIFRCLLLAGIFFSSAALHAEDWDYPQAFAGGGLGYESKMPDEATYEGTKVLLSGRYIFSEEKQPENKRRVCCIKPSTPTDFLGVVDGAVRIGADGTGIEYLKLGVTPWAKMWDPGAENTNDVRAKRDLLELGVSRYISDDALEVDHYAEFGFGRFGRLTEFRWSDQSQWSVLLGAQASLGWAWAKSTDKAYSSVSNPYAGIYIDLAISHQRYGQIYFANRFINGFSFSNPSRGHPTAREALVRNGYRKDIGKHYLLDVYWSKRSFYFDEGGLPSLYSWVRTYAAELNYKF